MRYSDACIHCAHTVCLGVPIDKNIAEHHRAYIEEFDKSDADNSSTSEQDVASIATVVRLDHHYPELWEASAS